MWNFAAVVAEQVVLLLVFRNEQQAAAVAAALGLPAAGLLGAVQHPVQLPGPLHFTEYTTQNHKFVNQKM